MNALLASGAEQQRADSLDRFLRRAFGLTVSAYPASLIRALLDALPPGRPLEHPDAQSVILRMLAIHETYFFRHPEQLKMLPALLLPKAPRPIRAWSAGCATGEEAYTLSVIMHRAGLGGYEVLGTDLDPAAIEVARQGCYRRWSLRGLDPEREADWLTWRDERAVVKPHIRQPVSFDTHNLMGDGWPSDLDLILCRNALIYFDEASIRQLYERFFEALRPGGILLIAASDPAPPWRSAWVREAHGRSFFFRRPEAPTAKPPRRAARRQAARAAKPTAKPTAKPAAKPAAKPTAKPAAKPAARSAEPGALVQRTMRALGAGERLAAQQSARRLLAQRPDGIIPNLLVSYALGDKTPYAAARLKKACDRLAALPDSAPVPLAGGMTAGQLLTILGDDNGLCSLIDRLQR